LAGDFTRRKPLWLMVYEQPECLQACFLGERGETVNGTFYFHASKHIDISKPRQRIAAQRASRREPARKNPVAIALHHLLPIDLRSCQFESAHSYSGDG